ncbi:hypothetical protein [Natrinema salinisoli]|uniref:hypothetical protein n=1 Tax=Natrinema salinisoli TaxID=2878535 RepID=UPI001CEFEE5B|nr:hypothetical protein [Natrinema salinisoli]
MRVSSVLYEGDDGVDQTDAQALAINEVLREPLSEQLEQQRTRLRYVVGVSAAAVVAGIGAFLASVGAAIGGGLVIAGIAIGGGGYKYLTSQDPDITVKSVQKGYWTGHCLPVQDGTVVYDATNSLETTAFELESLRDESAVTDAYEQLTDIEDLPVVMNRDDPIEVTVTNTLDHVQSQIENAEQYTVEAPIVAGSDPEADAVETFASMANAGDSVSAPVDVSVEKAESAIEELDELEQMATEDGAEADLESLSDTSRELAGELSGLQDTAIDLLNDHISMAADAFGMVSYNFYCPDCQTDDIESTVELSDPQAGDWYCETCRTTHGTDAVVPRHRIKDDIVNPVWDQLWVEKDDQRRELYENIEDQKSELHEREFEQRSEEIRTTTDRIRDLRSRIRDLKTEAKAAEGKVSEIGDLMVKYERLNEQRKSEFEQEVEASFSEIDAKTDRILEETRNEEQERIENAEQAAKEKAEIMREEKRRREVEKFVAAQEREDARVAAQMEHEQRLHDDEIAVEKQHHREDWMLETRGRTSFSGAVNRYRMKKDRLLGASARTHGGEK